MAVLRIDGDDLVLHMPLRQKVLGFHADLRAPLSAIRSVRATDSPYMTLRGRRMAGTAMRGVVALGTWIHGDRQYDFVALRRHPEGVVVEIATGRFERWVVGVPGGAREEAERIAAAAGIRAS